MPGPCATIVIPTLKAGEELAACLDALDRQTLSEFEVVVVDNSGQGLALPVVQGRARVTVVENRANAGFGEAVNQAFRQSAAPFLATLNDDAVAAPGWLEALLQAAGSDPRVGMCASRVLLAGQDRIDSAGMLASADASSKQRGHLQPPERFGEPCEVLLPSGSAALYRRAMLDEIGLFDPDFFLYCEDTDLGLRARWAGWTCRYAPGAVVEHRYSLSAGRASPLKAYLVERNRLFVLVKNYPLAMLAVAPFATLARYFWHLVAMARGHGAAAQYRQDGHSALGLAAIVLKAHLALLGSLPRLCRRRREIRRRARLSPAEFRHLIRRYSLSPKEVASL